MNANLLKNLCSSAFICVLFLWSFTRLFIQAPSGRQRFNVLGALDAINHELLTITNDTYINAASVCDLLRKVRTTCPDIPITFILDNARYQKCKVVWETAYRS